VIQPPGEHHKMGESGPEYEEGKITALLSIKRNG
jgi:hypothetical protein